MAPYSIFLSGALQQIYEQVLQHLGAAVRLFWWLIGFFPSYNSDQAV